MHRVRLPGRSCSPMKHRAMGGLPHLLRPLLEHLFVINIAVNAVGICRSIQFWRWRRRALQQERVAMLDGADPLEVVETQAALIHLLHDRCQHLRQLTDQQRELLLAGTEATTDSMTSSKGTREPCSPAASPSRRLQQQQPQQACSICCSAPKDLAFGCGHTTCARCGLILEDCPMCRLPIQQRIKLYL